MGNPAEGEPRHYTSGSIALSGARAAIRKLSFMFFFIFNSRVFWTLTSSSVRQSRALRICSRRDEESPARGEQGHHRPGPESASARETPVEGALRRGPVTERALRNASLGMEVTPWDRGPHDQTTGQGQERGTS